MDKDDIVKQQLTTPQKAMIKALEETLGIVSKAADKIGMERTSHYRWLKESEVYKEAFEDIDNLALDFSESALHDAIKEGNVTAIIFHLKTRGKKRGYTEKQEIELSGGLNVSTSFNIVGEDGKPIDK